MSRPLVKWGGGTRFLSASCAGQGTHLEVASAWRPWPGAVPRASRRWRTTSGSSPAWLKLSVPAERPTRQCCCRSTHVIPPRPRYVLVGHVDQDFVDGELAQGRLRDRPTVGVAPAEFGQQRRHRVERHFGIGRSRREGQHKQSGLRIKLLVGCGNQPTGQMLPQSVGVTLGRYASLSRQQCALVFAQQSQRLHAFAEPQQWVALDLAIVLANPIIHYWNDFRGFLDVSRFEVSGGRQRNAAVLGAVQKPLIRP